MVTDLREGAEGIVDLAGGRAERCPGEPIPPANVLIWHVGGDARVMIRPSGTEPEIKIYAEVVCPVRSRGELGVARENTASHVDQLLTAAAAALQAAMAEAVSGGLGPNRS
jgi:phosphomannomutase